MTVSGQTIIEGALYELNKLGQGQTIAPADLAFGLLKLNRLIDQWKAERRFVYYIAHESYPFAASKQSYTIGPSGADFNAARPVRIEYANLIVTETTPNYSKPLNVIEVSDYSEINVPAQSGAEPFVIYYQATHPNGTIFPWPYPENAPGPLANRLELYTWAQLSGFALASTTVELPPGYEEAITLTLAEKLAQAFGKTVSAEFRDETRKARSIIGHINTVAPRMKTCDFGIPTSQ